MKDILVLKYNSDGTLLWNMTWGGTKDDEGEGIAVDSAGNIYVAGTGPILGTIDIDAFVIKFGPSDIPGFTWMYIPMILGIIAVIWTFRKKEIKIN